MNAPSHAAFRSAVRFAPALLVVLLPALVSAQDDPASPPEPEPAPLPRAADVTDVPSLVRYIESRERRAKTVQMRLRTRGQFPNGAAFTTEGEIRVLGETHFLSRMTARFGADMEAETETVRTPAGMLMRERDPVQGEVYVRMDAATLARVESASRVLSERGGGGGALGGGGFQAPGGRAQSPLGSAMLVDLAKQFDLRVEGPSPIDGQRCWVVKGPVRGDGGDVDLLGLGADQVDVVVREADGAVLRMTRLRAGQPLIDIEIVELRLDVPLEPEEFRLSVTGPSFLDVFEHPPAAAQLERLFEEARAEGWKDPASTGGVAPATADKDG